MSALRLPQWTEYQESSGGRDPLGLDRVAGRFLDDTLPCITSQTRRARYYSAYCWIIGSVRSLVPRGEGRAFVAAFQRRETVFALASVAHHAGEGEESVGVAGYRRASKRWSEGGANCTIDFAVLKEPLGGLDAAYRAPMRNLGLLAESPEGMQLTPMGQSLGDAFGGTVSRATIVRDDLFTEHRVPRRAIERFAQSGCLCGLSDARERQILRDAFLKKGTAQFDTLVWLLDVAARAAQAEHGDRPLSETALEWAAYGHQLPDDTPYEPPTALLRIASRWRMLAALGFFAYFLEELASAVADLLRQQPSAMCVADLGAALLSEVPEEVVARSASRLGDFGIEHELYDEVRAAKSLTTRARIALDGLMAGYALHRGARGDEWSLFARYAGTDLWPGALRDLVEDLGESAPLRRVGEEIIDKLVLRHHQRVLYEKRRIDSTVFSRDGDLWRAEQRVDPRFLSSRLGNCVQILIDLGLLERTDVGVVPTPDGRAVLRGALGS